MAPLVALVSGSYRPDRCGVADYTRRLAQSLEAEGLRVIIVTSAQSIADAAPSASPPVLALAPNWRLSSLPGLIRGILKLKPDIVHIQHSASSFGHSHAFGLLPLLMKTMSSAVPLVTTTHEYGGWGIRPRFVPSRAVNWIASWLERRGLADREDLFLLSLSRAIIVTNQFHFDTISKSVPGVSHKLRLIPIGPNVIGSGDDREAARQRVLSRLALPPSTMLICYFGFIHPVKGLDHLLRAFAELQNRDGRAHLVVVGGVQNLSLTEEEAQSFHERLLALRDELGLTQAVTFTGYIEAEEVSHVLHASQLCVLPFNHGASLKSGSLLAALAHGLPVITTRTAATPSDLRDGDNVLLVPPRDPAALARALKRLASSPKLRESLSKGALALGQRFSWKEIAGEHARLYNTLVENRSLEPEHRQGG